MFQMPKFVSVGKMEQELQEDRPLFDFIKHTFADSVHDHLEIKCKIIKCNEIRKANVISLIGPRLVFLYRKVNNFDSASHGCSMRNC